VKLAIVVALAVLAIISWQWQRHRSAMDKSSQWAAHTQQVISQLDMLLSDLKDAETGQRGFLLTGDESYLEPYQQALGQLEQDQALLKILTKDNPRQQQRLTLMEPLIRSKLAELKETIDLYASSGVDAANAVVLTGRGKLLMDDIRRITAAALADEKQLLIQRSLANQKAAKNTVMTVMLGAGVSGVLLLTAFVFLYREITSHQRSEERFRALVTATSDVVFQLNPDWSEMRPLDDRGIFASTEKGSRTWHQDYNHPEDHPRIMAMIHEAIRTKSVFESEHRVRHMDGSWGWTVARVIPILDKHGEIVQWFGAAGDVTARKQAEEALRESEERLRLQIEMSPLAVIEWDKDFIVTRWAGAAEQMFGWSAAEAIGRTVTDLTLVFEDDLPIVENMMVKLLDGVTRQATLTNRNLAKDGRVIHCSWNNSVLRDGNGPLISTLSLVEDITEQTQTDEEIRQFNVTLGQRVIERTMELRETVSQLENEIAERQRLEREILEVSEREQNRLGQDLHDNLGQQLAGIGLLSEVLANRLKAESHPSAADAIQLKTYLAESISTSRNLARSFYPVELERGGLMLALKDLALRTEKLAKIPCILTGDDDGEIEKSAGIHLYRIAQEAVINALKHAKPGTIVIDCRTLNGTHTLSITDDGSGYNPPQEGCQTGMGLYILQYRARMIGAKVDVRRGASGGCVVTCTLPVATPGIAGQTDTHHVL